MRGSAGGGPCTGSGRWCHRRRRAFTLVEVLAVIFILAALASLLAPALQYARRRADRNFTQQEMTRLKLGIENFAGEDPYADWPPARLSSLGVAQSNGINEPNESMVLCLGTTRGEGPYFQFDLSRLLNRDSDAVDNETVRKKLRMSSPEGELFEYVDLWETPYVYVPFEAYGRTFTYLDADGNQFEAQLAKDPRKGTYPEPLRFAMWSCGPNGENENGQGDDIISWQ